MAMSGQTHRLIQPLLGLFTGAVVLGFEAFGSQETREFGVGGWHAIAVLVLEGPFGGVESAIGSWYFSGDSARRKARIPGNLTFGGLVSIVDRPF